MENITNHFLLFNIPVDIAFAEIGQEFSKSNDIKILEFHQFNQKDSTKHHSPALVTTFGTYPPLEIQLWFSIQVLEFIDHPS